jgi:dCMP deaminase
VFILDLKRLLGGSGDKYEVHDIPNWHDYFLDLCNFVSKRSKDKSKQVGCVIIGEGHNILSTGYNGFPRGVNDDVSERHERPLKYNWTIHAEANAVVNAAREGIRLLGSTLYVKAIPCSHCAGLIMNAGIGTVIVDGRGDWSKRRNSWMERWASEFDVSLDMFSSSSDISCFLYIGDNGIEPLLKDNWREI